MALFAKILNTLQNFFQSKHEKDSLSLQLRTQALRVKKSLEQLDTYAHLVRLLYDGQASALDTMATLFCNNFGMYKATIISISNDSASILSCYDASRNGLQKKKAHIFSHHTKVLPLLNDKELVYMGPYAMQMQRINFLDAQTFSVCFVPVRALGQLLGFVMLENNNKLRTFTDIDEAMLVHMANFLVNWMKTSSDRVLVEMPSLQPVDLPAKAPLLSPILQAAKKIYGLRVENAIQDMGGLADVYEKSIKMTERLLPATLEKMRLYLEDNDMKKFATEVHGLKGALYNIGKNDLGDLAADIEEAAMVNDCEHCEQLYDPFSDALVLFSQQLKQLLWVDSTAKTEGDPKLLTDALEKVKHAAMEYDSLKALALLEPLQGFSFDENWDLTLQNMRHALEEFDCERMLDILNNAELKGTVL